MSEKTPERLKEFRAQYGRPPRKHHPLALVHLLILVVGFGGLYWMLAPNIAVVEAPGHAPEAAVPGLPVDALREQAAYLAEKDLPDAAIESYEEYLRRAPLNASERAKVCYAVARVAIEAEQFQKALAYLYRSELLDPNSALKDETNKKVALCLDKLGRAVDLRRELRQRTDIARSAADVGSEEVVLAEFGGDVITDRDLELELEKLPTYARPPFTTTQEKADFLKNVVAERLLLDKARRLELDKDPEIQQLLADQLDKLVVARLIGDEIQARINVTPDDVERFYKAEPTRFTKPATAAVHVGKADSAEAAAALEEFPVQTVTVREGGNVPGVPDSSAATEAIFATEPGELAGPLEIEGAWYMFKVEATNPQQIMPFEDVKETAARMLKREKEQAQVGMLIEETLRERDVRLYPERIEGAPTTQ
ncbi:MAG TPA: hypothetical protein HPP83_12800 [Candidatus Hydrogenedentes bacterium]|nr:hypothetical protein [Candidatus Hydrogenedentota bacterium]